MSDTNHHAAEEYLAGFHASASIAQKALELAGTLWQTDAPGYPAFSMAYLNGSLAGLRSRGEWARGVRDGLAAGFGF